MSDYDTFEAWVRRGNLHDDTIQLMEWDVTDYSRPVLYRHGRKLKPHVDRRYNLFQSVAFLLLVGAVTYWLIR